MNDKRKIINKQLLEIAKRRCQPGTGSQLNKGVETMKDFSLNFLNIISSDFMVIGGYAAMTYMPERKTLDYDIMIRPEDELIVKQQILAADGKLIKPISKGEFLYEIQGKDVDVVNCYEPWFETAYQQAPQVWNVKIIPLEYLTLLKYKAGRYIDMQDVYRILSLAKPSQIAKLEKIIKQYLPNDLEDIESMIELGKIELQND